MPWYMSSAEPNLDQNDFHYLAQPQPITILLIKKFKIHHSECQKEQFVDSCADQVKDFNHH